MNRLTRYLFLLSLVFLMSSGLYIGSIYLRESQGSGLLNPSILRLLTFTGLIVPGVFFFVSALVSYVNPSWGERVLSEFERQINQEWVYKLIFLFSGTAFVFATIPFWNILIGGAARNLSVLLRFSPIVFLLGSLSLIVIRAKYFQGDRKKWIKFVFIASLCFGTGLLLQSILGNQLDLPLLVSIASQFIYAAVCLVFSIILIRQNLYDAYLLFVLVAFVLVLFVIQWFVFPHKLRGLLPGILLYAPIIIVGLPLISLLLMRLWNWLCEITQDKIIWIGQGVLIVSLILLALTYYRAARIHSLEINIDSTVSDQSAYMDFIKEARRLDFNYTGDHNRMPLYPFLQALFYSPDMDDLELFEQGKQNNLILSILLLICLFLVFLKLFGLYRAYLLILIIAFSLFIFKAAYIQAEILYYSLSALGFVLMLMMLTRPTWSRAIATGIIVGVAYLTKGTILASLPLFAFLYAIDLLLFAVQKKLNKKKEAVLIIVRRAAYLLAVLGMFAVIISPYAQALKQRFGHYFYNVNTTFYIWYDDWEEVEVEEAKHQFVTQWPAHLAEEELPSLRNYLRDHTWEQIADRFESGLQAQYKNIFLKSFGVSNYWISYLLIFLFGIFIQFDGFRKFLKSNLVPIVFVILYFAGYLFAFAWYCPIACGRRFIYALYIPFLIVIFLVMRELVKYQPGDPGKVENKIDLSRYFSASNLIIAISLIFDIWLVTTNVLFIDAYGS
ncbi:MAG: hypothetical protein AB8I56_14615 [Anaerolineales bacterium]